MSKTAPHLHHDRPPAGEAAMVKDPVCGMTVNPQKTPHRAEYEGRTYYFCCAGCRTKFIADPQQYLGKETKAPAPMPPGSVPKGAIYTCPMHPEIRQVGPGSCPICGMALEPVVVAAEAPPNPELIDMTRRFWIGLVLTLPVAALQMSGHFTEISAWIAPGLSNWVQLAFATPVVLWAGWPFFVRGWRSFVARKLNMFSLIAIGTGVAWVYSVVATLAPELFPSAFRGHEG
ncbi:MAG: YHS domain-containing protein, partial [Xanthobacteraceae bacterium]